MRPTNVKINQKQNTKKPFPFWVKIGIIFSSRWLKQPEVCQFSQSSSREQLGLTLLTFHGFNNGREKSLALQYSDCLVQKRQSRPVSRLTLLEFYIYESQHCKSIRAERLSSQRASFLLWKTLVLQLCYTEKRGRRSSKIVQVSSPY